MFLKTLALTAPGSGAAILDGWGGGAGPGGRYRGAILSTLGEWRFEGTTMGRPTVSQPWGTSAISFSNLG